MTSFGRDRTSSDMPSAADSVLICQFRPDGTLTFVNTAYADWFGYQPTDLVGTNLLDLIPPAAQTRVHQQLRELTTLTPKHPYAIHQHQVQRPDGSIGWQQWINLARFDHQGQLLDVQSVGFDLTHHYRTVQALHDYQQRFRNVLETMALIGLVLDGQGTILLCNDFLLDLTGWERQEVLGKRWLEVFIPEDGRDSLWQVFQQELAQGTIPTHYENEIVTRHGERRLIAWNNTLLKRPDGTVETITSIGQDITEQRRAIQQLQTNEERFLTALEAAQMGTWDWDLDSGTIVWSSSLEKLMGLEPGRFDGRLETVQQLIHPADRDRVTTAITQALEHDADYAIEFRFVRPDGSIRWAYSKGDVFRDPTGHPLRMSGVDVDITARKQAEVDLQTTKARLQTVTANASAAVLHSVRDRQGQDRVTYVTAKCTDIWELEPEQILQDANQLWQMMHPEDRARLENAMADSAKTLNPWYADWRILPPSGQQKWLQGMARPERLANGDTAWETVIVDISDRKRAEQALAHTNRQLQSFMDNTPAVVSLIDRDGRYIKVNQALADQFGLQAEDLTGKTLQDVMPPQVINTFMARIQQVITSQTPMTVEDQLTLPSGHKIFRTVLFPILDEHSHSQAIGAIATDVTSLIQAQIASRCQAEEERLVRTITQHIHQSLDVDTILQTTVAEVRQFLQTDRVLIYQFNPDWSGTMVVESVAPAWIATLGMTLSDTCFMTNAALLERYRQGHTSYCDNIYASDLTPCYQNLLAQFQVQANLVVPINCGGNLWGLLCIHHCRAPRSWYPREIALVKQLADQVAIALYQGQLLSQTSLMAQQEKLLNHLISAISDSLDLNEVMKRAAKQILDTLQASRCMIVLCQAQDEMAGYTAFALDATSTDPQGQAIPIRDNPHVQWILSQAEPVAVDDISTEPTLAQLRPQVQALQIGAMLDVAIRYKTVVKGMLCLHQCHTPRQWTPEEIRLIKRVADHLAIAIHQAELYQQAQAELYQRKRLEAQLRHEASHDKLTNLPNRTFFLERLSQALYQYHQHCPHDVLTPENLQQNPHQFAVLFLDLDRFKVINDSLGHAIGDRLLRVVAQRILDCLHTTDTAARLGGDEFVILLTGQAANMPVVMQLVRRIDRALEVPILLDNYEIFVRSSVGIAFSSAAYTDPNQVLRDADIAMYQAKASNREYAIFDVPMHALAVRQMQLENDLRRAIERQEFELHYQPIVDLATEQLQGFEALVRWRHPERGLVSPMDFIPVAENTGVITSIDLWTLNQACRQLRQWHLQFPAMQFLTVNVNLSGRQFVRPDLIQQIDQALQASQLNGHSLKVEMTESVLIHNAQMAIDLLHQLRQRQIQVCMDDFGTGYSSLSYLHRFPIDVLKIDKSFVSNLHRSDQSQGDYEIVKAIISLTASLNLAVVAEGIETAEQAAYLREHQCWGGQGYYFSKPLTIDRATAFIAQQSPSALQPL